jgi:hypothetical protein
MKWGQATFFSDVGRSGVCAVELDQCGYLPLTSNRLGTLS